MQAGIRKKEYAVAVIFGRLVLPIVIGGGMALWVYGMGALAEWSAFKRYGIVATAFILAYKAHDLYLKNKINKRTDANRQGLPDGVDLLVLCAEAGPAVDARRAERRVGNEGVSTCRYGGAL